ncbi:MAG: hypothetical protein V4635_03625 [Bacteroidota bacterium]
MKDHSFIYFRTLCFFVFLISCIDSEKKTGQWTKEEALKLIDSVEIQNLIAAYNDGDGYCLLIKNENAKDGLRKITRTPGYPDIVDTLFRTDTNTFRSLKNQTLFLVKETEVVVTLFQKIIHPSSNWQGQTPWQETIVSTYLRRDLNLK